MQWLPSKGSKFREEGGSPSEGGFWAEETREERGWLPPAPSSWDRACAWPLVRGQQDLECCPLPGPAPHFRQGIWPTPGFY